MKIKIIGAGGIGGWLIHPLCRFLNSKPHQYQKAVVYIIDGDKFEPKNADRQNFRNLENKADELVSVLANAYDKLVFRAESRYITRENAASLLGEGDYIFGCVDNHATRKIIDDRCRQLEEVLHISGGNSFTLADVHVHKRWKGKDLSPPLAVAYDEIQNPTDRHPNDPVPAPKAGCGAIIESGEAQLIFTNNLVATCMLNAFYAHEDDSLSYHAIRSDVNGDSKKVVFAFADEKWTRRVL